MDRNDKRAHVEHVLDVMERMRPAAGVPTDGPEWLLRSWRRSIEAHKLDPCAKALRRVYTASEVRETWDRLDLFRDIARPHVSDLFRQLAAANYCVIVTDATGLTIDLMTGNALEPTLRNAGVLVGTVWAETEEGTCGVGTAIMDRKPVLVHKADHFRVDNLPLSCSAAPILGLDDELIAVLDASTLNSPYSRDSQSLVFEMVADRAQAIENAYVAQMLRRHWRLWLGQRPDPAGAPSGELLLAFDDSGTVVGANRVARERLLTRFGRRQDVKIDEVVDCSAHALVAGAHNAPGVAIPVRLGPHGQTMYALLRAPERAASASLSDRRTSAVAADTTAESVHAREPDDALSALALGDARMRAHAARARKLADKPLPVMLLGETGAGKELFARAVHAVSRRRSRPFVAVNCAAIPESLIESELFGYREGAFTGARARGAPGKLQQANGGTLFLDEIGDMPLALQSRLLRALAEGEVLPLGAMEPVPVELHVICATHQNLSELVQRGGFREDLYYRLNGAVFELPALRDRQDMAEVIQRVLVQEAAAAGLDPIELSPSALDVMLRYGWPGNVRQLRHALRYACAVAEHGRIDVACLPAEIAAAQTMQPCASRAVSHGAAPVEHRPIDPSRPRPESRIIDSFSATDRALRERMLEALAAQRWCVTAAARQLDMPRSTFYRKMVAFDIAGPTRMLEDRI